MSEVHENIRNWLHEQSDWLQEAADRLLKEGALDEEDVQAIASSLKTAEGQTVTKHRAFSTLNSVSRDSGQLRLVGLSEVQGIENLGPGSPLSFGKGNLVVVYGHNGSGKSGYTRILKRACGKPRALALKPNVFSKPPDKRQCSISYETSSGYVSQVWSADGEAIAALGAVDIFDSDEAAHYLTKESSAGYVPPLVSVFAKLASVCDRVRTQLTTEQEKLVSKLPAMPPDYAGSGPALRYTALQANFKPSDVDQLTVWTEKEAQQLHQLTERLKVADPSAEALKCRSRKTRVESLEAALKSGFSAFSQNGLQAVRHLQAQAGDRRRIATEAAKLGSSLLDGIGEPTWKAMWEAARAYSQIVYPGSAFPLTGDESRCPLCQQELAADAKHRLHSFEAFVQSKLEGDASQAETAYREALQTLTTVPSAEQLATVCVASGLAEATWLDELTSFWGAAGLARAALLAGEAETLAAPVAEIAELCGKLQERVQSLEDESQQLDKDAMEFDRPNATADKS
ncbi:MAG: restriction endonuclease, partial [Alphaproteobacteria bacterium]|nr:restriction endonuclease [Alphaproteobacteria bacterium]